MGHDAGKRTGAPKSTHCEFNFRKAKERAGQGFRSSSVCGYPWERLGRERRRAVGCRSRSVNLDGAAPLGVFGL